MYNQLKVEFYKLRKFPILYVAMLFMGVIGFVYGYLKFDFADNTSQVFSRVVCDSSFIFVFTVITAWFIGEDFGNRTITNELKLGFSRLSVILIRAIVVSITTILLHLIYIVFTIGGFSIVHGFDTSVLSRENVAWMVTVLLQLIAIACLVVMICFTVRKIAGAIAVSVICIFALCNVLRNFLIDTKVFTTSCFYLAHNNDLSWLITCGIIALLSGALFFLAAVLLFRRADIK